LSSITVPYVPGKFTTSIRLFVALLFWRATAEELLEPGLGSATGTLNCCLEAKQTRVRDKHLKDALIKLRQINLEDFLGAHAVAL
jgi:hypothetical protein